LGAPSPCRFISAPHLQEIIRSSTWSSATLPLSSASVKRITTEAARTAHNQAPLGPAAVSARFRRGRQSRTARNLPRVGNEHFPWHSW